MKAENRGQLVRGVLAVGVGRASYLSFDPVEMEKRDSGVVAYTPWHRHDEDLSVVEKELNALVAVYSSFNDISGISYTYEYKDYKR